MAERLFYCDTCDIHLTGPQPALQHYSGKKHQKNEAMKQCLTNSAVHSATGNPLVPSGHCSSVSVVSPTTEPDSGSSLATLSDWMPKPSNTSNSASSAANYVAAAPRSNIVMVPSLNPDLPPIPVVMSDSLLPQSESDHCTSLLRTPPDRMPTSITTSNSVSAARSRNVVMVPSLNPDLPPVPVTMTENMLPQTEYDFDGNCGSCNLCGIELSSQQHAQQHLSGQNHIKAKKRWEMKRDQLKQAVSGLSVSMQSKPIAMCQPLPVKEPASGVVAQASTTRAVPAAVHQFSTVASALQWFQCDVCNKYTNTFEELEIHRRSTEHVQKADRQQHRLVPGDNTVWLTCHVCQKRLNSPAQLDIHAASHGAPASLAQNSLSSPDGTRASPVAHGAHYCDVCQKSMNTAAQLELHRQSPLHNKKVAQRDNLQFGAVADNTIWYHCPLCSKKVNSANQLEIHIISHGLPARPPLPHHVSQAGSSTRSTGAIVALFKQRLLSERKTNVALLDPVPSTENVTEDVDGSKSAHSMNQLQLGDAVMRTADKDVTPIKLEQDYGAEPAQTTSDTVTSLVGQQMDLTAAATAVIRANDEGNKHVASVKLPQALVSACQQLTSDSVASPVGRDSTAAAADGGDDDDDDDKDANAKDKDTTTADSEQLQTSENFTDLAGQQNELSATVAAAASVVDDNDDHKENGVDMNADIERGESAGCDYANDSLAADDDDVRVRDEDLITTECCQYVGCVFHCELCDMHLNGDESKNMHLTGSRHVANREKAEQPSAAEFSALFPGFRYGCELCQVPFNTLKDKQQHESGQQHIARSIRRVAVPRRSLPRLVLPTDGDAEEDCRPSRLVTSHPRMYQEELYHKALANNSICFLPTGTGKTLVAVMVMSRLLSLNPHHSAVLVVDRVLLALQQRTFLRRELRDKLFPRWNESRGAVEHRRLRVAMLCGPKGDLQAADLWQHDVIVITAAHYINLLETGSMHWADCCLVVIDEVHHCLKDHPYSRLIRHHLQIDAGSRPRLLGLTASPAGRETAAATVTMLRQLMYNLGVDRLATVEKNLAELDHYQARTVLEVRLVGSSVSEQEHEFRCQLCSYLAACYRKLYSVCDSQSQQELDALPFPDDTPTSGLIQTMDLSSEIHSELIRWLLDIVDRLEAVDSPSKVPLAFLKTHMKAVGMAIDGLDSLGLECAYSDLAVLVKSDGFSHAQELNLPCERLETIVAGHLDELDRTTSSVGVIDDIVESTKKSAVFTQLVCELEKWWDSRPTGDDASKLPMALVLARKRSTTSLLASLLQSSPSLAQREMSVMHVIGHGSGGQHAGMSVPQQSRALQDIQRGKHHVVVATSVAEEGVDLPDCDVVIQLDAPDCVRALVQVRGRARKSDSRFIAFCRDAEQKSQLDSLLQQEQHMVAAVRQVISEC